MLARWRAMSRRQRALLAAAAGAAAAAAAYVASAQLAAWREEERQLAQRALEQQQEQEEHDRQEERKLHEHFDSIQRISDTTTLPSLLPALRERLYRLVDVDALTARLMAAHGPEALTPAQKYAAWEELAVLSFARTLSAAWSVCLLDLFVRVQLNLLGSHLYLASALAGTPPQPGRRAGAPALSPGAQQAYLALANHFPQEGLPVLVERAVAACRRVLAAVPLKAQLSHAELVALLGRCQEAFELDVAGGRPDACDAGAPWAALLLPRGEPVQLAGGATGGEDAQLLGVLLSETRTTLQGGRFAAVVRHALDAAAGVLAASLRGAFGPDAAAAAEARVPLAKLVPSVAAAADDALRPPPPPPRSAAVRAGAAADVDTLAGIAEEDDSDEDSSGSEGDAAQHAAGGAGLPARRRSRRRRKGASVASALASLRPVDSFCADLFSSV